MRAAFDEVMRAGVQHQRGAAEILGDLLRAELAEKTARSIRYQMSAALAIVLGPMADDGSLPVMKHLAEFDFDATSVNEAQVARPP